MRSLWVATFSLLVGCAARPVAKSAPDDPASLPPPGTISAYAMAARAREIVLTWDGIAAADYYEVQTAEREERPYRKASLLPLRLPNAEAHYEFSVRGKPGERLWFVVVGHDLEGHEAGRSHPQQEEFLAKDTLFAERDLLKRTEKLVQEMRKRDPGFATGGLYFGGGIWYEDGHLKKEPGSDVSEMHEMMP